MTLPLSGTVGDTRIIAKGSLMKMLGWGGRASGLSVAAFLAASAFGAEASAQTVPGYSPPKLDWSQGEPIPPGYHPSTEIRQGFVIAGSVTLGVSWVFGGVIPGIIVLAGGGGGYGVPLLIPAIGPFISMGTIAGAAGSGGSVGGAVLAVLAVDGLVQSAGAALLIYGVVAKKDVLVRNDRVGNTTVTWMPTPMAVGQRGQGFGIVGTF
jgi:hypothetical protein